MNMTSKNCVMKKLSLLFAFISGVIVSALCFFYPLESKNEEVVLNMLTTSNMELLEKQTLLYEQLVEKDTNSFSERLLLLNKMKDISRYCNSILDSKKYDSFSIDTLKAIISDSLYDIHADNFIRWEPFYETAGQMKLSKRTQKANEYYINMCLHIALEKCMEKYREFALMTDWGKCMVIPTSDTIKQGDYYEAEVYFAIKDIGNTYTLIFLPDTSIQIKDVYREKAITPGQNTRQGLIPFSNADGRIFYYPVEFSYYVK